MICNYLAITLRAALVAAHFLSCPIDLRSIDHCGSLFLSSSLLLSFLFFPFCNVCQRRWQRSHLSSQFSVLRPCPYWHCSCSLLISSGSAFCIFLLWMFSKGRLLWACPLYGIVGTPRETPACFLCGHCECVRLSIEGVTINLGAFNSKIAFDICTMNIFYIYHCFMKYLNRKFSTKIF